MRTAHSFLLFLVIYLAQSVSAKQKIENHQDAGSATPVRYTISLFDLDRHLLHVHVEIPLGQAEHDLQLPVWNATYQVRDFAQYVNWLRARTPGGRALDMRLLDKSRWHISGAKGGAFVDYEIYADSAGPFGAQVNPHHAFLNLAEVLIYPVDDRSHKDVVSFEIPKEWHIATPLPGPTFEAENYDRLVD
ncbi:MAG: hypothetical protein WAN03_11555, partial [Candidatus Sulfotelmatobacter sp.]